MAECAGLHQQMVFGCAIHDQVLIHLVMDRAADNGGILVPTGVYNPERRVVVGDLLSVRKRNGKRPKR